MVMKIAGKGDVAMPKNPAAEEYYLTNQYLSKSSVLTFEYFNGSKTTTLGYDALKLSEFAAMNFLKGASGMLVSFDVVVDIYVATKPDSSGTYKGKSIWIQGYRVATEDTFRCSVNDQYLEFKSSQFGNKSFINAKNLNFSFGDLFTFEVVSKTNSWVPLTPTLETREGQTNGLGIGVSGAIVAQSDIHNGELQVTATRDENNVYSYEVWLSGYRADERAYAVDFEFCSVNYDATFAMEEAIPESTTKPKLFTLKATQNSFRRGFLRFHVHNAMEDYVVGYDNLTEGSVGKSCSPYPDAVYLPYDDWTFYEISVDLNQATFAAGAISGRFLTITKNTRISTYRSIVVNAPSKWNRIDATTYLKSQDEPYLRPEIKHELVSHDSTVTTYEEADGMHKFTFKSPCSTYMNAVFSRVEDGVIVESVEARFGKSTASPATFTLSETVGPSGYLTFEKSKYLGWEIEIDESVETLAKTTHNPEELDSEFGNIFVKFRVTQESPLIFTLRHAEITAPLYGENYQFTEYDSSRFIDEQGYLVLPKGIYWLEVKAQRLFIDKGMAVGRVFSIVPTAEDELVPVLHAFSARVTNANPNEKPTSMGVQVYSYNESWRGITLDRDSDGVYRGSAEIAGPIAMLCFQWGGVYSNKIAFDGTTTHYDLKLISYGTGLTVDTDYSVTVRFDAGKLAHWNPKAKNFQIIPSVLNRSTGFAWTETSQGRMPMTSGDGAHYEYTYDDDDALRCIQLVFEQGSDDKETIRLYPEGHLFFPGKTYEIDVDDLTWHDYGGVWRMHAVVREVAE